MNMRHSRAAHGEISVSDVRRIARVPEGVMMREVQGEAVLLHLDTGEYFGLDAVGTRVWQLIGEHADLAKVTDALVSEFDVAPDVAARDVRALVETLVSKQVLEVEVEGG